MLEEENIELLRENKDLRISSATYRAKAEALARKLGTTVEADVESTATPGTGKKRNATTSGVENTPVISEAKKQKENDENDVSFPLTASVDKQPVSSARSFGTALDENTLNVTDSTSSAATKPTAAARRGRRVKAKAVGASSTDSSTEQPGECAQS